MKALFLRLCLPLVLVLPLTLMSMGTAQAYTGCSKSKTVPGVSIYFSYCDSTPSAHHWREWGHFVNNHGDDIQLLVQTNIRIDGKDHFSLEHTLWLYDVGVEEGAIYNQNPWENNDLNSCTPGHVYFPILRARVQVNGSAWSQ